MEGRASTRDLEREPRPRPLVDPEPLSELDDRERALFEWLIAELEPAGVLSAVDRAVATEWAVTYAAWERTVADVRERGPIVDGARRGRERVRNPSVGMATNLAATLHRLQVELGMTPSSRSSIRMPGRRRETLEEILSS
jgi:P27 family predicted phage terminase small subunit